MKSPRIAAALFALAGALVLPLLLPAPAAQAAPGGAYRVLVDAGHGGSDPGALSDSPRLVEKDVTLRAALATGAGSRRGSTRAPARAKRAAAIRGLFIVYQSLTAGGRRVLPPGR
ncbi:MAG TPA: hypothetical protein VNK05_16240, partial [Chloroflexota bacterium]|nr:hypothetical protein [Chloroflexota bacterium]